MKRLSNWLLLILIASVLLLSAAKPSYSTPNHPREITQGPTDQSISGQQNGRDHHNIVDNGSVDPVASADPDKGSNPQTDPKTNQEQSDWWMVWLTAVLCAVTFFQLCTFWVQYRAMVFSERAQIIVLLMGPPPINQAAPNQVVVFVAQQQKEVTPQGAPASTTIPTGTPQFQLALPGSPVPQPPRPGLFVFAPNQHAECRVAIENIGNTPAYNVTFDTWLELITPPFNDFPEGTRVSSNKAGRTIYPKNAMQTAITIMTDHTVSELEHNQFTQGQRQLWLRIRVYYRDTFFHLFRRSRFADFGWAFSNVGQDVIAKYQSSN